MKEFSEDEKTIARSIDKRYKWMARDSYGDIYVYRKKPTKLDTCWNTFSRSGGLLVFNYMFKPIKWEDDEPTRISDIYAPRILDDAERKYLKNVLKPFHDEVEYVVKSARHLRRDGTYDNEYLSIEFQDGNFTFPDFDSGKMYVGMEREKKYTLNELGITYTEGEK